MSSCYVSDETTSELQWWVLQSQSSMESVSRLIVSLLSVIYLLFVFNSFSFIMRFFRSVCVLNSWQGSIDCTLNRFYSRQVFNIHFNHLDLERVLTTSWTHLFCGHVQCKGSENPLALISSLGLPALAVNALSWHRWVNWCWWLNANGCWMLALEKTHATLLKWFGNVIQIVIQNMWHMNCIPVNVRLRSSYAKNQTKWRCC